MSARSWWEHVIAAQIEVDLNKLESKVSDAKAAIIARYQELQGTSDSADERQDLKEASQVLRQLEIDRLGYPPVTDENGCRVD